MWINFENILGASIVREKPERLGIPCVDQTQCNTEDSMTTTVSALYLKAVWPAFFSKTVEKNDEVSSGAVGLKNAALMLYFLLVISGLGSD